MRSFLKQPLFFSLIFIATLMSVFGQVEKASQPPNSPVLEPRNKGILIEASEDYRISPGDILEIQIEDASELSKVYRVNASGAIPFSPFGSVKCQGQTAETLARQIEKFLKENDYLKTPQVIVSVKQYNSQTFYVHGEVRQPGVYQVEGHPSILKLISLAGGLTGKQGVTIFLLQPDRKVKQISADTAVASTSSLATASVETLNNTQTFSSMDMVSVGNGLQSEYALNKIRIGELLKGDPKHNLRVEPESVLYIPEADVFYVGGEVNHTGSFPIKEAATLRQAISLANGYTNKANPSKSVIFREKPGTTQRDEIKVNIKEIMDGKQQDIALQSNDIIVIPDSKVKAFTSSFLTTLPSGAAVMLGQIPFIFR